jgi:hypothetical protein
VSQSCLDGCTLDIQCENCNCHATREWPQGSAKENVGDVISIGNGTMHENGHGADPTRERSRQQRKIDSIAFEIL